MGYCDLSAMCQYDMSFLNTRLIVRSFVSIESNGQSAVMGKTCSS